MEHPLSLFAQGIAAALGELIRQLHQQILGTALFHIRGHRAQKHAVAAKVIDLQSCAFQQLKVGEERSLFLCRQLHHQRLQQQLGRNIPIVCRQFLEELTVFRIRLGGRIRSLRCYLRPMRHLKEIYGQRLLEKELYLHTSPETGVWVDTVLGDWIEGSTLHETVAQAAALRDRESLQILVRLFDRLALALVTDDRAHGDLKPENIIVGDDGTLCPIDFDASYLPAFAGEISPELGTAAYQHPARTAADFDERIDDYPAALISTALHALAEDPTLWDRYGSSDGLLYTPQRIASDPAYRETLALFEKRGMAVQYRIAQLLTAPTLRLFGLAELLAEAVREKPAARSGTEAETPELFVENGRWGYRTAERVVVAPLYDNGFDFTEGLAAVQLGGTWHYIDTAGRTRLSCPGCAAVKPFRGGKAQVVRNGERQEIAHPLKTPRYQ